MDRNKQSRKEAKLIAELDKFKEMLDFSPLVVGGSEETALAEMRKELGRSEDMRVVEEEIANLQYNEQKYQ